MPKDDFINNCWYQNVCGFAEGNPCSATTTCPRYLEMEYLMQNSGLPRCKQSPIMLELLDVEDKQAYNRLACIKKDIFDFVSSGSNLIIASKHTGNGKTSWAIKILLKYFDEVWSGNGFRVRGLFVHVPTLLLQLKDFNNPLSNQYKQDLLNADLVVWDDICSVSISEYDYSQLLLYLENRLFNEKSNIFTSNIDNKEDFNDALGAKLTSRIWNTSELIIFKGTDKRALKGA